MVHLILKFFFIYASIFKAMCYANVCCSCMIVSNAFLYLFSFLFFPVALRLQYESLRTC